MFALHLQLAGRNGCRRRTPLRAALDLVTSSRAKERRQRPTMPPHPAHRHAEQPCQQHTLYVSGSPAEFSSPASFRRTDPRQRRPRPPAQQHASPQQKFPSQRDRGRLLQTHRCAACVAATVTAAAVTAARRPPPSPPRPVSAGAVDAAAAGAMAAGAGGGGLVCGGGGGQSPPALSQYLRQKLNQTL